MLIDAHASIIPELSSQNETVKNAVADIADTQPKSLNNLSEAAKKILQAAELIRNKI